MRLFWLFMLFVSVLFGVEVDSKVPFGEILSKSSYYIDYNNSATIKDIEKRDFKPVRTKELGFGYSPNFAVWIKFVLTNRSNKKITKIIEYDNPLTSYVDFYDAKSKKLLKSSGMLNKNSNESINPILKVKLKPHESRAFYIKISSKVTTLIAKLYAWNVNNYNAKLKEKQIILALFFGAMGIIILYNSVIFFMTRKMLFLYYVLAFVGILSYYLLYQGITPMFLPKEAMRILTDLIPFIVLVPVVFLSLFTKEILELNSRPKLNRVFNIFLVIAVISTFVFYLLQIHSLRSVSYLILFFMLLVFPIFSYKKNVYAKFLLISWAVFFATALFMYLESISCFYISKYFPYYSEVALLFEALSFSLILALNIKKMELDKIKAEDEAKYRELLVDELDHRVSGSLQSFMFAIEKEERKKDLDLKDLKEHIFAIADIYRHLNKTSSFPDVNMQEYFTFIIEGLKKVYDYPYITINIDANVVLKPKKAKTCAKILYEAVSNIHKYAFADNSGEVTIKLIEESSRYTFIIADNGKGIKTKREGSMGLFLMSSFVEKELKGKIEIDSTNGVKIAIRW